MRRWALRSLDDNRGSNRYYQAEAIRFIMNNCRSTTVRLNPVVLSIITCRLHNEHCSRHGAEHVGARQ